MGNIVGKSGEISPNRYQSSLGQSETLESDFEPFRIFLDVLLS